MVDLVALPPKQAIEYFKQKGYAVGFDYRDVWQGEHQASFTVAKVMQQDILADIRQEVARAIQEGIPYQQFAKTLIPTLQAKGWWGRQTMIDPLSGEAVDVQLGSPRRLKVIYDTNLRTAHCEGQWVRIQDNKEAFPYLEYDANNSAHPRQVHAAWDKLILPVDDPFWQSHFPIKDYGCKCRVISRTRSQVAKAGSAVGPSPVVPTRPYVNSRTGELQQIPAGVSPSFHYPPGGRRAGLNQHLIEELETAPPALTRASVADLVTGPAFATWYQKPAGTFALAQLNTSISARLGAKTQLLAFSDEALATQLGEHPEITLGDYALVQTVIDHGVVMSGSESDRLVYQLEEAGIVTTVEITRMGDQVFMTNLTRKASQD